MQFAKRTFPTDVSVLRWLNAISIRIHIKLRLTRLTADRIGFSYSINENFALELWKFIKYLRYLIVSRIYATLFVMEFANFIIKLKVYKKIYSTWYKYNRLTPNMIYLKRNVFANANAIFIVKRKKPIRVGNKIESANPHFSHTPKAIRKVYIRQIAYKNMISKRVRLRDRKSVRWSAFPCFQLTSLRFCIKQNVVFSEESTSVLYVFRFDFVREDRVANSVTCWIGTRKYHG